MSQDPHESKVLLTEPAQRQLREQFFRWQCRIRQMSVRKAEARPTSGMTPTVRLPGVADGATRLTVLIVKVDPAVTEQFRFYFRKTVDPVERRDNAIKYLSAAYYQEPQSFAEELSALVGGQHPVADELLRNGECTLEFEQYSQSFSIPCSVREAVAEDPVYEATYWHNSLFNPNIPPDARVLAFKPLWRKASADPAET